MKRFERREPQRCVPTVFLFFGIKVCRRAPWCIAVVRLIVEDDDAHRSPVRAQQPIEHRFRAFGPGVRLRKPGAEEPLLFPAGVLHSVRSASALELLEIEDRPTHLAQLTLETARGDGPPEAVPRFRVECPEPVAHREVRRYGEKVNRAVTSRRPP